MTVQPLNVSPHADHAYPLYGIRLDTERAKISRAEIFKALRENGIGVNVHYLPLNLQPYYQCRFGAYRGQCPAAEAAYEQIRSLPIYPSMTAREFARIVEALSRILS